VQSVCTDLGGKDLLQKGVPNRCSEVMGHQFATSERHGHTMQPQDCGFAAHEAFECRQDRVLAERIYATSHSARPVGIT